MRIIFTLMKFGKLADISQVDFSLPPVNSDTEVFLGKISGKQPLSVYIGCPMWGNKDWVGKLYPKGAKAGEFLYYYSRAFNCIEMNTTHYRSPSSEMVLKWKSQAASNFRFCPKMPQSISHYNKLQGSSDQTIQFCDAISHFETQLGCVFMQMHDSFGPGMLDKLEAYLADFPKEIPLCIEFRHPGWFHDHYLIPEAVEILRTYHTGTVITDVAGRRDVLHTTLTSDIAVIRFVGNALVSTDYSRVDAWGNRIAHWADKGLRELYFFVHEPDDIFAPEMGIYAIKQFNAHLGLQLPVPRLYHDSSEQMRLF